MVSIIFIHVFICWTFTELCLLASHPIEQDAGCTELVCFCGGSRLKQVSWCEQVLQGCGWGYFGHLTLPRNNMYKSINPQGLPHTAERS